MKYIQSPAASDIAKKIRRNDSKEFLLFLAECVGGGLLMFAGFILLIVMMAAF